MPCITYISISVLTRDKWELKLLITLFSAVYNISITAYIIHSYPLSSQSLSTGIHEATHLNSVCTWSGYMTIYLISVHKSPLAVIWKQQSIGVAMLKAIKQITKILMLLFASVNLVLCVCSQAEHCFQLGICCQCTYQILHHDGCD